MRQRIVVAAVLALGDENVPEWLVAEGQLERRLGVVGPEELAIAAGDLLLCTSIDAKLYAVNGFQLKGVAAINKILEQKE